MNGEGPEPANGIRVGDGITLEYRWDGDETATRLAVFCHPHPMQRGTMTAPLMNQVTDHLVTAGFRVLRFNFRGVGASTGTHDHGRGEIDDVAAAVELARTSQPTLPMGICGWSFGAAVALRWQAGTGSTRPYVGIAPPLRSDTSPELPEPGELAVAPRRLILGDRDQFTGVGDLRGYAESIGAELVVLEGSDHFFYFREQRVADAVAGGLSDSSSAGGGAP